MSTFLKKIFKKKKPEEKKKPEDLAESNDENLSLEDRIRNSIWKCEKDKNTTLDEINQLRAWANDAIKKVFKVPPKYWYKEVEEYENIKKLNENIHIGHLLLVKIDEVVAGYKNQISLQKSKLVFFESLIEDYTINLKKSIEAKEKLLQQKLEDEKMLYLDEHLQRLSQMDDDVSSIEKSLKISDKLVAIETEIEAIENDFKFKEECYDELEKLNNTYKDPNTYSNSVIYKSEIEKLTNHITKQKSN